MVRIIENDHIQKDYEPIIQELFIDLYKAVSQTEYKTIHGKYTSKRKLFKGLINDLKDLDMSTVPQEATKTTTKETKVDPSRAARTLLKKRMVAYFEKTAQERKEQSERFWIEYVKYETIIRKCFHYIFMKKYPNYNREDEAESYNELLVTLEKQNVFQKFNPNHLRVSTLPAEKRYEQFLYKWIESYLSREYNERKTRSMMFRRTSSINDIHTGSFIPNLVTKSEIDIYIEPDLMSPAQKESEYKTRDRDHLRAVEKHIDSPEAPDGVIKDLEVEDLWDSIYKACHSDTERRIVTLRKEGYNNKEIGKQLDYSGENISLILDKIRGRMKKDLIAA
jgi:hypothetical protein